MQTHSEQCAWEVAIFLAHRGGAVARVVAAESGAGGGAGGGSGRGGDRGDGVTRQRRRVGLGRVGRVDLGWRVATCPACSEEMPCARDLCRRGKRVSTCAYTHTGWELKVAYH